MEILQLPALHDEQPHAVDMFSAALAHARMHHAYLLLAAHPQQAIRLAAAVAAALVCNEPQNGAACGQCSGCRKLGGDNHPDVVHLQPNDKGIIPIDAVRHTAARLSLRASEAATKVVLVDHADHMNTAAQNALLKTLEEPPGATCFLLTATHQRRLLPTVRSRCQTVRLAASDLLQAWQKLAVADIDPPLARSLAPVVGPDVAAAQTLLEAGADTVLPALQRVLTTEADAGEILALAAELGSDKGHADVALAILEVLVRDGLARSHGVGATMLYTDMPQVDSQSARLARAAARLMRLRRLQAFNVNRTMALEGVLLELRGALPPRSAA